MGISDHVDHHGDKFHATVQSTLVFLAPCTEETYTTMLVCVIHLRGKVKAEIWRTMSTLGANTASRRRHGMLVSLDTDRDVQRSWEL